MKVGSIVVALTMPPLPDKSKPYVKWLPVQDEETPYMVREIFEDDEPLIRLEEGIVGYNPETGVEYGLPMKYFREILPPEDISEVIEECMLSENTIANAVTRVKHSVNKLIKSL